MPGIPHQDSHIIPTTNRGPSLDNHIRPNINRILHITANPTLTSTLIRCDGVAAVIGKVCLHDTRRVFYVASRFVPISTDIGALLLVAGIYVGFLGRYIIGALEVGFTMGSGAVSGLQIVKVKKGVAARRVVVTRRGRALLLGALHVVR